MSRSEIIEDLANMVASLGQHTVDLSGGAKFSIIVEVVKSICCLSVVRDYNRFCKFNLLSVCGRPEKRTADDEKGNQMIILNNLSNIFIGDKIYFYSILLK